MTNEEWFRNLSNEEIAKIMSREICCANCFIGRTDCLKIMKNLRKKEILPDCKDVFLTWFGQKRKENDDDKQGMA